MSGRQPRLCALLLCVALVACDGEEEPVEQAGTGAGARSDGGDAGDDWPSDWAAKELRVLELVNAHRTSGATNIMKAEFESLGVGYAFESGSRYSHYWTQTFGGR